MNHQPVTLPSPRAHLRATLRLFDALQAEAPPHRAAEVLREFIDRPDDLPEQAGADGRALKYDLYLTRRPGGMAWGMAVADSHEGAAMRGPVIEALKALSPQLDPGPVFALQDALPGSPSLVFALGFDQPSRPPRVKLYLQEADWRGGLGNATAVAETLEAVAPGCTWPIWLAERAVGVLALNLHPSGKTSAKAYIGGGDLQRLISGGPPELRPLGRQYAAGSPRAGGHYYLTVRMTPGTPVRYALNKIYNPVQDAFSGEPARVTEAWNDVGGLFASAANTGAYDVVDRVRRRLPSLVVTPTATALEDEGRSTDVYFGAWPVPS